LRQLRFNRIQNTTDYSSDRSAIFGFQFQRLIISEKVWKKNQILFLKSQKNPVNERFLLLEYGNIIYILLSDRKIESSSENEKVLVERRLWVSKIGLKSPTSKGTIE
jgi:hypothetical protein